MKQLSAAVAISLLFCFSLGCDEEKPPEIDFEDPGRYYLINLEYAWTYARLGLQCVVSPEDTIVVTAQRKATRLVEGVSQNGWDLVSDGGGTGFVYRVADTIFYWADVTLQVPPYKVLVGPITKGAFWTDRPRHNLEYYIEGFEDYYAASGGQTFRGCAKVKRTDPTETGATYTWWSSPWGKVKEARYDSVQCREGWELKRRKTNPQYP
jgi:hypothetical protein